MDENTAAFLLIYMCMEHERRHKTCVHRGACDRMAGRVHPSRPCNSNQEDDVTWYMYRCDCCNEYEEDKNV